MRKILIISVCFMLLMPLYAELKVSYTAGKVDIIRGEEQLEGKTGMVLEKEDKVKTGTDGRAVLLMDGKSRIWLKQNSEMEITSVGQENYFGLLFGKMRAKVKKLAGRKFRVKTPVSVASIRGTDFVLSSDGVLAVLTGNVEFSGADMDKIIEVVQNQMAFIEESGLLTSREMTPEELEALVDEWIEFTFDKDDEEGEGSGEEGKKEDEGLSQEEIASLRQELLQIVSQIKQDIQQAHEKADELKKSDMSAGRTLRDVHGNLVRVEQHLLRTDDKTLQILNLTERPEGYHYNDRLGWGYNGPSGSRIDVMEVKMEMNMGLPEQLSEWPSFISGKGDDLHPATVELRITNQEDEIKNVGVWKLEGELNETGDVLDEDGLVFSSYINGYKVDPNYDSTDREAEGLTGVLLDGDDADGSDSGDLWAWGKSPQIKIYDEDNPSDVKYVSLWTEGYTINNSGNILNLDDFANSNENPFTLMKKVAGEQIVFCRYTQGANAGEDFFTRGNLDLVATPDIVIAVAQKLAGQIGKLTEGSED
ncbi:MAG: FecR domain-containing protein [Endomicrobiales bacterium]|nr:FecR domain-containing protein [Endomicrobiales bacterium]